MCLCLCVCVLVGYPEAVGAGLFVGGGMYSWNEEEVK